MSTTHGAATPTDEGHSAHQGDHHEGAGHGSFKSYMTGFVLSVILTAIPFWLVMSNVLGKSSLTALAIMALAAIQIVVHMIYFLHMNTKSEGGWIMLAFMFTIVVVVITLSGSLWVMYHLNTNMMPSHLPDMRVRP
ncbi:cytochrome o ubiquinol oxidase subunit IV [Enterovirga rhinocerotis]|uniref:Cytochrome bo(3) ubiquinol oxidase subunit 4 n=1 Tax=Enterovirga rhinocerotis TaxID=1339210 RepID=A0A4R7BWT8_9HYPH|nr:cytochrome o ubiquinol oxidase subunit IV [Enterovirga rhinocerotis]TDR89652.1 cytochrome bo3 quinol oxidase subunit 4 [Enterovirga rhinocerotis]